MIYKNKILYYNMTTSCKCILYSYNKKCFYRNPQTMPPLEYQYWNETFLAKKQKNMKELLDIGLSYSENKKKEYMKILIDTNKINKKNDKNDKNDKDYKINKTETKKK